MLPYVICREINNRIKLKAYLSVTRTIYYKRDIYFILYEDLKECVIKPLKRAIKRVNVKFYAFFPNQHQFHSL